MTQDNLHLLAGLEYPGRLLLVGRTKDAQQDVIAYAERYSILSTHTEHCDDLASSETKWVLCAKKFPSVVAC